MIPIDSDLYGDIVRFSDGKVSPEQLIEDLVLNWIANSAGSGDDWWGERTAEVRAKYSGGVGRVSTSGVPLVWKGVDLAPGTSVKMTYGGSDHFGEVRDGKIVDQDGGFTPSEWASKVAQGTSRNAWRDLWLKAPGAAQWVRADKLRIGKGNENSASVEAILSGLLNKEKK